MNQLKTAISRKLAQARKPVREMGVAISVNEGQSQNRGIESTAIPEQRKCFLCCKLALRIRGLGLRGFGLQGCMPISLSIDEACAGIEKADYRRLQCHLC